MKYISCLTSIGTLIYSNFVEPFKEEIVKNRYFLLILIALFVSKIVFASQEKAMESPVEEIQAEVCCISDGSGNAFANICEPTVVIFNFRTAKTESETTQSYNKIFKYKIFEKAKEGLRIEESNKNPLTSFNSFTHYKSLIKLRRMNN